MCHEIHEHRRDVWSAHAGESAAALGRAEFGRPVSASGIASQRRDERCELAFREFEPTNRLGKAGYEMGLDLPEAIEI